MFHEATLQPLVENVNANSVDVMRLNILSSGLLGPIGTSRDKQPEGQAQK